MLRNDKVEMAHDYQQKLTDIDVLKAEVQRLTKVEDENKMLRLVFLALSLITKVPMSHRR